MNANALIDAKILFFNILYCVDKQMLSQYFLFVNTFFAKFIKKIVAQQIIM